MTRSEPALPTVRARLLLVICAGLLWPAAAAAGTYKEVRDWFAACDNGRNCAAFALTDNAPGGYLRIDRDGAPNAPARITIVVRAESGLPFEMAFDDPSIPGLPKGPIMMTGDERMKIAFSDPADAEAMLAALRKAQKITIAYTVAANRKPDERIIAEISLSGASGAMLWIDEQQKRLDTVTALVGRGAKPASSVPAPPPLPVIKRQRAGKAPIPKVFPPPLAAKIKTACGEGEDRAQAGEVNRLTGNLLLYWIECPGISGAYNFFSVPIIAPADRPKALRMIKLPGVPGEKREDDLGALMTNGSLDPATLVLSEFNKSRGIGDCGEWMEWAWDGQAFRAYRARAMGRCAGLPIEEWPLMYQATIR